MAGGSLVKVGSRVNVGMGSGVLVGMLIGVRVGIAVMVGVGVFMTGSSADVVIPLTEGLVPQSTRALRQFVTSFFKTAGSQALKKSW